MAPHPREGFYCRSEGKMLEASGRVHTEFVREWGGRERSEKEEASEPREEPQTERLLGYTGVLSLGKGSPASGLKR